MCYDIGLFICGSMELFYVSESSGWSDLFSSWKLIWNTFSYSVWFSSYSKLINEFLKIYLILKSSSFPSFKLYILFI